jgi:hypothetical protein
MDLVGKMGLTSAAHFPAIAMHRTFARHERDSKYKDFESVERFKGSII